MNVRKVGLFISHKQCESTYDNIAECGDGDLRLVGGGSENSGQLQVCFSQRWGTVNGDGWTAVDTQVACRQLGFNTAGNHSSVIEVHIHYPCR